MTQDRRKDDKLPEGPLVFTDRNLTAAGLAHLEAERAAACLVHAGGDVWVGAGTKDALRGLLSEDTASHSQAVPPELASLTRYEPSDGGMFLNNVSGEYVEYREVERLFSHSAATGKVVDAEEISPGYYRISCGGVWATAYEQASELQEKLLARIAKSALASPAAPLAGKAEQTAIYQVKAGEDWWHDTDKGHWDNYVPESRRVVYTAPLAAAVPAEEASAEDWEDRFGTGIKPWSFRILPNQPLDIVANAMQAELNDLRKIVAAARLSKPTAQGTASEMPKRPKVHMLSGKDLNSMHCLYTSGQMDEYGKACFEAGRHIAAQATAGRDAVQWISVDERPPETEVPVLMYGRDAVSVHCGKGGLMVGKRRSDREGGHFWLNLISGSSEARFVTHWMPLPAAPHAAEQTEGGVK